MCPRQWFTGVLSTWTIYLRPGFSLRLRRSINSASTIIFWLTRRERETAKIKDIKNVLHILYFNKNVYFNDFILPTFFIYNKKVGNKNVWMCKQFQLEVLYVDNVLQEVCLYSEHATYSTWGHTAKIIINVFIQCCNVFLFY